MRYLSLFSGIEACSVAWESLGWQCAAVAEIEPFPCAVLKHRFPYVPNLGDITKITQQQIEQLGPIDLVVGGFPCQDLSVAGKRKGLNNADGTLTRSGLFFTAECIAEWSKARWLLVENVPGLFSSNEGRDFAAVVGELSGADFDVPPDGWANAGVALGPDGLVEWATLDAQYCRVDTHPRAVPQRRRRVFIVRDSGGQWQNRPPLFLVPESLRGNSPPSRSTGERITGSLSARTEGGGGLGTDFELGGGLTTTDPCAAHTLLGKPNSSHAADQETYVAHALRREGHDASEDGTGRGTPIVSCPVAWALQERDSKGCDSDTKEGHLIPVTVPSLDASYGRLQGTSGQDLNHGHGHQVTIPFDTTQITSAANRSTPEPGDPCHPLATGAHAPAIAFMADDFKNGTFEESDASRPLTTSADRERSAPIIAFSSKDHGADASEEVSPTLRAVPHDKSHENGGIPPAVMTMAVRGRGPARELECRNDGTANAVLTPNGGRDGMGVGAIAIQDIRAGDKDQNGIGVNGDGACYTLDQTGAQGVACPADSGTLRSASESPPSHGKQNGTDRETLVACPTADTLSVGANQTTGFKSDIASVGMMVRRLTPTECERLQGFPDGWTLIPVGKKTSADGPRYKALGNSMATNCMRWIGKRIAQVDALTYGRSAQS